METSWTKDLAVLIDPEFIFNVFPLQTMSPVQKQNALARFAVMYSILGYYLFGSSPLKYSGLLAVVLLFFMHNNAEPVESLPVKVAVDQGAEIAAATAQAFDTSDDAAKKVPIVPSKELADRKTNGDKLRKKFKRGVELRESELKETMLDRNRKVQMLMSDPRELMTRGQVLPSQEEKIYATRPYVRDQTEEYDSIWQSGTGQYKFFYRNKTF